MTFAVRPVGLFNSATWTFLGAVTQVIGTGSPATLPATALAGDLLVVAAGTNATITLGDKTANVGSSSSCIYKICSGGETTYNATSGGGAATVLMFRPGGAVNMRYGLSQTTASTTISTPPVGPGLYVGALTTISNYTVTHASPSGVTGYVATGNGTAGLGYKFLADGEVVGTANITTTSPYTSTRSFGIFDFT